MCSLRQRIRVLTEITHFIFRMYMIPFRVPFESFSEARRDYFRFLGLADHLSLASVFPFRDVGVKGAVPPIGSRVDANKYSCG